MLFGKKTDFAPSKKRLPAGRKIDASWYDEDYFSGKKSNWSVPYEETNFGNLFRNIGSFLVEGFPMARSIIDAGCAKGFLVNGILEVSRINEIPVHPEGFDISATAIRDCHPKAKAYVQRDSIDTYRFQRSFDLLAMLDILEHCTEKQVEVWLKRSREWIGDSIFAQIPLDTSFGVYDEPSHINIHNRKWWHEMFCDCGWQFTKQAKDQRILAMRDILPQSLKWEVFIYRSGNWEYD